VDESLALSDLAGEILAHGHSARLFLDDQELDLGASLRDARPDVVLVQAAFMAEPWIRRAVALVPRGVPSILIGTAATFDDDLLRRVSATAAIQGELDDSVPRALDALHRDADPSVAPGWTYVDARGQLRKTPWGEPPDELDARPMPHRALYFDAYPFLGRFPWKRFATGRGCVHSCGFCYLPGLREGYGSALPNVRRKSVDRVIAEVKAVQARWPLRRVHFADDLFAPNRPWLEEFSDRFPREVGLPFTCATSPETVTDKNAELLAKSGARVVGIGLETASERVRLDQLGRTTTDAAIRRAAARLKAAGIQILTFNMLANPNETLDEALQTVRLNQEIGTDFARVNLAFPAPRSRMERWLRERGRTAPPMDTFVRGEWRAWCAQGDPRPFEVLCRLFRLAIRLKLDERTVKRLVEGLSRVPDLGLLSPLSVYDGWVESRWSGVTPLEALQYARKAGRPNQRVTYHESLP
jgi:radical SAM superfamily enzyme YgiQ (UPF0313 family)